FKSFVAIAGNDANDCSTPALACRSFQRAQNQTISGGQIACVDSLDVGGMTTINRTITIDCAGTSATADLFIINAANIVVVMRNLAIIDGGGIDFQNGSSLIVESCVLSENDSGIVFRPSTADARLFVTNTLIQNNGTGSSGAGIF